jgi:very-short-patch-repair endonuclease
VDPLEKLEVAWRRLPPGSAFSVLTAAWLHGLDVLPCNPIEATLPYEARVSGRSGIALRRTSFAPGDIVTVRKQRATAMPLTLTDLCRRLSLVEAVVVADAALHKRLSRMEQLTSWVASSAGRHGIKRLRRVVELVEPATESPMETRLRMILVLGGLPRPRAQVTIYDSRGRFVGRPDLYYERQRLGIEYDGSTHRDSIAEDNWRQNRLLGAGVRLLRFTAADVLGNPESVLFQVRGMLTTEFAGKIASPRRAQHEFAGKIAS